MIAVVAKMVLNDICTGVQIPFTIVRDSVYWA